jgi:hypothetical protein
MRITAEIDLTIICPHCKLIMCRHESGKYYCGNSKCIFWNKLFKNVYEDSVHFVTLEEYKVET